jgi:hypothetical protein
VTKLGGGGSLDLLPKLAATIVGVQPILLKEKN